MKILYHFFISMMRNAYISLICRMILGGVLIYAGWIKLFNMESLATAIERYRILPVETVNVFAVILPPIEVITGICLIVGGFLEGAVTITTLLFLFFLVAIESAILRGLDIECGCFGTSDAEIVGTKVLIRDVFFLFCTLPIWWSAKQVFSLDSWFNRSAKILPVAPAVEESNSHV